MKKHVLRLLGAMAFFAIVSSMVQATTIIPYQDLGNLVESSDAVVYAKVIQQYEKRENGITYFRIKLVVSEHIKGKMQTGDGFEVQKWEKVIEDQWMSMWGDIDLYDGSTYLMFLSDRGSGLYHPLCFSYYLFEEITAEGHSYMVPSEAAREFVLTTEDGIEPLFVYDTEPLLTELRAISAGVKEWESEHVKTGLSREFFFAQRSAREAPSYCSYLSSNGKFFRWEDFETESVAVHYSASPASGCSAANTYTRQAIQDLNVAYPGIHLTDGGTFVRADPCSFGSALGGNYRSWVNVEMGGTRHIVIQYDDPCNEIGDLNGCSGTLAIGGLYSYGSHTYNGESWYAGSYGYVVVNNDVGQCKCGNEFKEIISHEVTHGLGLGHISQSGMTANMNPFCCDQITQIDQTCIEYSYSSTAAVLPLELLGFSGIAQGFVNELTWQTAWEADVEAFVIEKADKNNPEHFEDVALVESKGNTEVGHEYEWTDFIPEEQSYYRLRSVDFSGEISYSNVIVLQHDIVDKAIIYPTITSDYLNLRIPNRQTAEIRIASPTGKQVYSEIVVNPLSTLSVGDLPQGSYYLQVESDGYMETLRFVKTD